MYNIRKNLSVSKAVDPYKISNRILPFSREIIQFEFLPT